LATYSFARLGWEKGEPKRFINGHNARLLAQPRPPVRNDVLDGQEVVHIPLTRGFWTIVDKQNEHFAQMHFYYRKGYAFTQVGGKAVRLHSLIFDYPSGLEPDHINGDGLDNRVSNLRAATHSQNVANQGPRSNHPTGYKGVTILPNGRFRSRIRASGKQINLGIHDTVEAAAFAYDTVAFSIYGNYARLNLPHLRGVHLRQEVTS